MLRIKLSRVGKKKKPVYRVLVMERSKDPWGNFLENVGTYNPHLNDQPYQLKEDRVKYWLSVGAQPTDTVHNILVDAGLIEGKKLRASNLGKAYKQKVKDEEEKKLAEAQAAKEAEEAKKAEAEAAKEASDAEAKEAEPAKEEAPAEEAKEEPKAEEPAKEEKKEDADDAKKE